jgi:hypothetical protein
MYLLPLTAFIGVFLLYGDLDRERGWRSIFLRSAITWGAYAILSLEILSRFSFVNTTGLSAVWSVPILASLAWFIRQSMRHGTPRRPSWKWPERWADRILIACILVVFLITALVAWFTPPQTWDSLSYHMSKVAHWAQDQAVHHFATGIDFQNSMSPGAEMLVLHLYVLGQGDRLAAFVEWFAMVGSVIGVSLIAKQLGARTSGQVIAAVFAATLPMGIVQASSTMTDYVLAFWIGCVAVESLEIVTGGLRADRVLYVSLAAGLAILTKWTALAYLLPFAIIIAVTAFRQERFSRVLLIGTASMILVAGITGGYLLRNRALYGNPVGDPEKIEVHSIQKYSAVGIVSNLLRNASVHAESPWPQWNDGISLLIRKVHVKLGIALDDPDTTMGGIFTQVMGLSRQEDRAGNPFHALLFLLTFAMAFLFPRRVNALTRVYLMLVAATFLLFSATIQWHVFVSRLHMPFFILAAAPVGVVLGQLIPERYGWFTGIMMLVLSWGWLFRIESRPLFPDPDARTESILTAPRTDLYFANRPDLQSPYEEVVQSITESSCKAVGIMLEGSGAEYPLWALLGAPDPGLRIEWIVSDVPSEIYRDPGFDPCALICSSCPEHWTSFRDLPLKYRSDGIRLFMR